MPTSEVFGHAAVIALKHRTLWVPGFLVSVGGMGISFFGGGGTTPRRSGISPTQTQFNNPPPIMTLWERAWEHPELQGVLLTILCIAIFVAAVAFLLSIIGRGGLIGGVLAVEDKNNVTVAEAWELGLRYFGRLLSVRLLLYAPIVAYVFFTFCLGAASIFLPFAGFCLLPLICILTALMLVVSVATALAERGIVADDLTAVEAYQHSWRLLRANLSNLLIATGILLVAKAFLGFLTAVILGIAVLPAIVGLNPDEPNIWLVIGSGVLFIGLFPVVAILSSVIAVWDSSAWTLLYRRLTRRSAAITPSTIL